MGGILMGAGKLFIRDVRIGSPDRVPEHICVAGGVVRQPDAFPENEADMVVDARGAVAIPGLVDVHVHFREPGFEYKETIRSGSIAAAAGGFTSVCTMPNLKPAPDSMPNLRRQLDIIDADAAIEVLPYATITKSRLGAETIDYDALAPYVCGFSDDGSGIDDENVMLRAMTQVARTGKVLAEHCEVKALLDGGCIHKGSFASRHNLPGICSESEWHEVERNIHLAEKTGCRLHICHVSTKESVELIREGKRRGVDVTAETAAHYIAFCEDDMTDDGRFKMNPPLRGADDRQALIQGLQDGTIDCIASDHAPHAPHEKNLGLRRSAMGVSGIELSLPAIYSFAVASGLIPFQRMIELMAINPRRIFGIKGGLGTGHRADIALVDFDREFTVDAANLLSAGKVTPFLGTRLNGAVLATIAGGNIVYCNSSFSKQVKGK